MIAGNPLSGGRPAGRGPGPQAPAGTPPAAAAESVAEPRLVVGSTGRGSTGQDLALGVAIDHPADAAGLLIGGLPDGASLSAGQLSGANQWYVPAADAAGVVVRPARGFAGAVDLSVELRLPRGRIAERRAVRLEWGRPAAPTPSAAVAGLPPRQLDPEEIASLRRRGEALFANGDIAAARLMLMRAAEAADARSALLLATTYDPMALADSGIRGAFANPALARAWYERAKAFGSPDAPRRLELLASQEH
jgi:TPR repeat protein